MAISKTLQDKLDRLDSVPDAFNNRVSAYQRTLFAQIIELIGLLERENGFVVASLSNFNIISEISRGLQSAVTGQEYVNAVGEFAREFDGQASIFTEYLLQEFGEITPLTLANQALQISKRDAINRLLGQSLKRPILDPIEGLITEAVTSGSRYTDLVRSIQNFATGTSEVDGLLLRYSKQISYDAFAVADRSFGLLAAKDLNVQFYRYQGGTIKDTREFCQVRNGQFYHHNEIEEWGAFGDWSGKFKGTNEQSIFVYLGGYNCRHSIVPVSLVSVPKEILLRNIQSGNYKPTAFEAQELGLSVE